MFAITLAMILQMKPIFRNLMQIDQALVGISYTFPDIINQGMSRPITDLIKNPEALL